MESIKITKDMTMSQILEAYPGAQRALFQGFHIGGCQSCGFSENDTLEQVCKNHQLEVEPVIAHVYKSYELDQKIQVAPKEVAEMLKRKEKFKLLDVREPWEHELAHIEGAILVSDDSIVQEIMTWPKDTTIIVHCHQGMRSLDAASYLIGHGFTNVRSIAGGINAWSKEVDTKVPTYV